MQLISKISYLSSNASIRTESISSTIVSNDYFRREKVKDPVIARCIHARDTPTRGVVPLTIPGIFFPSINPTQRFQSVTSSQRQPSSTRAIIVLTPLLSLFTVAMKSRWKLSSISRSFQQFQR